jgi:putative ABC transport system permease protein
MFDMMDSMFNAQTSTNNLQAFKEYLDNGGGGITDLASIHYGYDLKFDVYTQDTDGAIIKSDVITLMQQAMGTMYGGDYSSFFSSSMGSMYESMDVWQELLPGEDGTLVGEQVLDQYDLLYGAWPENYDEVILFVDERNEISDLMLYALGLISTQEMDDALTDMMNGEEVDSQQLSWSYQELCDSQFKLILPAEYYQRDEGTGTYVDMSSTDTGMDYLYHSDEVGTTLKVVGIARPSEKATSGMVTGAIGYTSALTDYAIETADRMDIVQRQLEDDTTDVFTGLPFATGEETEPTLAEKQEAITEYLSGLTAAEKAAAYVDAMSQPGDDYVQTIVAQQMDGLTREAIVDMTVQQYAAEMGVDAATVQSYIDQMSDEELFAQVEEAITAQVREQYAQGVAAQMGAMSQDQLAQSLDLILTGAGSMAPFTDAQYSYLYDNYMPPTVSEATYQENLDALGYIDPSSPSSVSLYAATFADKDEIADLIRDYNDGVDEEDQISYTDYVALLMSSITTIISGITYVLIAFVAISLIVSSIMIGVITLISVQERTKEIGILRAIGASKRDVSGMFNAETMIVGFAAGLLGVVVTYLLCIPINLILHKVTGIATLSAVLPLPAALILIAISVILTLISGLIPSRSAAKKDPVEALRTE